MARPREFDRNLVLEKAMQVFWSRGYEATSLADLTRSMGLSKSSLYDTFGSKHDLFLEVIDYYRENVSSQIRSIIGIDAPTRQVIANVLGRAVDRILDPVGKRGCLLNNTAVELGPNDPEAAARCSAGLSVVEETFHRLLTRAQAKGEITADKDIRALARFFTSTINGIMVMGKADPDRARLEDIARTALEVLD